MSSYNIGVSSVGSGIGQSILKALNISSFNVQIHGFDVNPFTNGNFECDSYAISPSVSEAIYIDWVLAFCKKKKIHVLIPGLDSDVQLFSFHEKRFISIGVSVLVSNYSLVQFCRQKHLLYKEFGSISSIIVKSYEKIELLSALEGSETSLPVIAKPKTGSGSQGVKIVNSIAEINELDDDYFFQEIASPNQSDLFYDSYIEGVKRNKNSQVAEISLQLIANMEGDVLAKMATYNNLKNGVPVFIMPFESKIIEEGIQKLLPRLKELGLKGPINIQGRLTDDGFKIFEINPRFTGITGLRAVMGFNEVECCVKEILGLGNQAHLLVMNKTKFGIRQITEKVVTLDKNSEVLNLFEKVNFGYTKAQLKKLLITGATGYIGRNLLEYITEKSLKFEVIALVRDKKYAEKILPSSVKIIDFNDINNGAYQLGVIDILLHLAFSRPHRTSNEIADSLRFTNLLFEKAVASQIPNIINVSSQSVYGQHQMPPWDEEVAVAPETTYAFAKYATELALESLASQYRHINFTSIRLGSVIGGADGMLDADLITKFVNQAMSSNQIILEGPEQVIERIDIRDAVSALYEVLLNTSIKWNPVYNVGSSNPVRLDEIAKLIIDVTSNRLKIVKPEIKIKSKDNLLFFGLDCSSFRKHFEWEPKITLVESINSIITYLTK